MASTVGGKDAAIEPPGNCLLYTTPHPSRWGCFFQNKGIFFDFNDLSSDTLSFAKALCSSPIPTFGLTHSLHMPS